MLTNLGLSVSQAVSPLIVRQSSSLVNAPPPATIANCGTGDKFPPEIIIDESSIPDQGNAEIPLPSEGTIDLDLDSGIGDPVEVSGEAEPPLFPKICVPLLAPGWEPSSSAGDFVQAHNKFVGNDSMQTGRLRGPPTHSGLRRSASVSSQSLITK